MRGILEGAALGGLADAMIGDDESIVNGALGGAILGAGAAMFLSDVWE